MIIKVIIGHLTNFLSVHIGIIFLSFQNKYVVDKSELKELREIFSSINTKDPIDLRGWFTEYKELMTSEHCLIMRCSDFTVRKLKKFAGVSPVLLIELDGEFILETYQPPEQYTKSKDYDIKVPDEWETNAEWLYDTYVRRGYGLPAIRQVTNASYTKIIKCLNQNGIKTRSSTLVSDNPKCNKAWILENYFRRRLSLKKCGELAGVSAVTIRNWILKFGMMPREY